MTTRDAEEKNDNQLEDDIFGEPPLDAFEEEEHPKKNKRLRRIIIRLIALLVAFAMVFQTGSFLFEHFSLNALRFTSESNELTADGSFESFEKAVVTVQAASGHGTGFVISNSGEVLTNEHVIRNAMDIQVTFAEGGRYTAELVQEDPETDLALLQITEHDSFPYLDLADEPAVPDDTVYVIGHPLTHSFIVNEGNVKETTGSYQVVNITNAVFPGHSGSPVLSDQGEVVGVVYARQQGGEESGEGLAVPLQRIRSFLDD